MLGSLVDCLVEGWEGCSCTLEVFCGDELAGLPYRVLHSLLTARVEDLAARRDAESFLS